MSSNSAKHPGLKPLRRALIGRVCTGGTYPVPPESLGLHYRNEKEATFINLANASNDELEALNKACQPATFGRGTEDILDETYRKAGKMDLTNFMCSFERSCSDIMKIVRAHLVEDFDEKAHAVTAELYKLNVYDKGSFFKPHKDTPRAENMFASLVIVFPTPHEGGSLVLRHKRQEWTFNPPSSGKSEVGYIAFYSDVKHEVLPVTSGYRVTLTYNLYFEKSETETATETSNSFTAMKVLDNPFKAALQELLNDSSFLPEGGRLGFGLYHQYPYNFKHNTSLDNIKFLKGSDATLYRVCKDLGLEANVRVLYSQPPYFSNAQVLLDHFVHVGGEIDEDVVDLLRDEHHGEVIRRDGGRRKQEDGDVPELVWATPKTKFNRLEENYITYGNESQAELLYGDICIIVEIGDYASRRGRY